jgi:ribosomal protein S18 acetylase RimI-like enzyme
VGGFADPCLVGPDRVTDIVHELEELAFRAWPAEEVSELDGWRLRFTRGVTNRANSVWPNVATGALTIGARVDAAREFYRARGARSRFQITAAAEPPGLDAYLSERGYLVHSPVSVETLGIEEFRFAGQPPKLTTSVRSSPDDDWFHVSVERGRFAGAKEIYAGILDRIGQRAGFAVAKRSGKPISMGLGVVEGEWLGIFNMATLEEDRRQHAATAILAALVGWGSARGATRAYLQVEEENLPARALYRSSGFAPAYSYHYRAEPHTTP